MMLSPVPYLPNTKSLLKVIQSGFFLSCLNSAVAILAIQHYVKGFLAGAEVSINKIIPQFLCTPQKT